MNVINKKNNKTKRVQMVYPAKKGLAAKKAQEVIPVHRVNEDAKVIVAIKANKVYPA